MMIVEVVRKASFIEIDRTRILPIPGRVSVKIGDRVQPEDVVAEAAIPAEIFIMDVSQGLGVPPLEVLQCLVREMGEMLEQGDVIAQALGTIPRLVRAPANGRLIACDQGKIALALGEHLIRCQAGMFGVVEDVIPDYGVVLSGRGTLLQGVWGNGKLGSGVLKVMDESMDHPIKSGDLETLDKEQALAAGFCSSKDDLVHLAEKGLRGLILGVLSPDLIPVVKDFPMPVIVLQGFGDFLPDPHSFELLQSCNNHLASINASPTDIAAGDRSEVFIPLQAGVLEEDLEFRTDLIPGQRVQVCSGEQWGKTGTIIDLPNQPVQFESGLFAFSATIQLENGETVSVPCQNLIVVG